MKITIDNYKQIFDELKNGLSKIENSRSETIKDSLKKIKTKVEEVRKGGDALSQKNSVLKIGVVGQVKAGKSSFLNSLLFDGENVLPKASTPMTAGLTILEYGEKNEFEVEYYNRREWEVFEDDAKTYDDLVENMKADNPAMTEEEAAKGIDSRYVAAKELVSNCARNTRLLIQETSKKETKPFSDIAGLQNTLETYIGAHGTYTSIVKSLTIRLHDERLKDMQIVDTPGVNDPVLSRELRTREYLRECHGVFFLSYSGRFFDSTDVTFLTDRIGSQGIGEVVLIGSKFDSVLQDVGMKYKDELVSALEYCQRALKKQYATNIATSAFQGKDPTLDFSSGIGYSIAKKDESKWDDMERHVVKQMKTFYPKFFSTPTEIRDTFMNLSQIEDIREKYVENTFKHRKDEIIKSKINAYFANASTNLQKILSKEKQQLEDKRNLLAQNDIGSLTKQEKALNGIIESIKNDMSSITTIMGETADRYVKECMNEYSFRWDGHLPATTAEAKFQRKGTFWGGNKTFTTQYEKVNLPRLIDDICDKYETTLEQLSKNWDKKNGKIRDDIFNKVSQIIMESEKNDQYGEVNTNILRNILDETLAAMSNRSTLNLVKLKARFKEDLTRTLTGKDCINPQIGQCSEGEALSKVEIAARKAKNEIAGLVNTCISATFTDIEKNALRPAREASISVLTSNKDRFIEEVKKSTHDVLEKLRNDLKSKQENLQAIETAINELTKIENNI